MNLNEYRFKEMKTDIENLKNVINSNFSHEQFIFKLSFENKYNSENDFLIRFTLCNTIGNTYENNGLIYLYHKHYDFNNSELTENEITIKFFELQKELKSIFDFTYEISDNRE